MAGDGSYVVEFVAFFWGRFEDSIGESVINNLEVKPSLGDHYVFLYISQPRYFLHCLARCLNCFADPHALFQPAHLNPIRGLQLLSNLVQL